MTGAIVSRSAWPRPTRDGLRGLARGVESVTGRWWVRAAIESMSGAWFVYRELDFTPSGG
jgi:hypothetical protein